MMRWGRHRLLWLLLGGVSLAVAKAGETATNVLQAADVLKRQADMLQQEVDQFLRTVRAA